MIFLLVLSGSLYFILILIFFFGWLKLDSFKANKKVDTVKVSIIIPIRNEVRNIPFILNCILQQSYNPRFLEIIVVDDHSTDNSFKLAKTIIADRGIVVQLPENTTGKKSAIWEGLSIANGEIIITTDADCIADKDWIITLVSYFSQKKSIILLAPVIGKEPFKIFEKWQQIELLSLLGATAGSAAVKHPTMCNGANMAFSREIIEELKPIYKSKKVASGDDMFVLEYVKMKFPDRIQFLKSKEATVRTALSSNIHQFFNQRKRWASKAKFYKSPDIIITATIVLLINLTLLLFFLFGLFTNNYFYFLILFGLKTITDFLLTFSVARYYKTTNLLLWFPLLQVIYFFYVSNTFLGSFTGKFNWKSRTLKA